MRGFSLSDFIWNVPYTRTGLPECVVSTMSGPLPETAQDRTQTKGHTPNPRIGIKIPDPAGNRTRAAGLEGRDSTDHTTATDHNIFKSLIYINNCGQNNLSCNLYLKLLYMSWNFYRKVLNVFLQNPMCMKHFEICILKLILRKLIDQLNWNFVFSLFLWCRMHSRKIIKL